MGPGEVAHQEAEIFGDVDPNDGTGEGQLGPDEETIPAEFDPELPVDDVHMVSSLHLFLWRV